MTRAELIEKAKAWLTKNHPLAPAAEHQVARYADFALAVLEEERGKRPEAGTTADGVEVRRGDSVWWPHFGVAEGVAFDGGSVSIIDPKKVPRCRVHVNECYSTQAAAEEASRG